MNIHSSPIRACRRCTHFKRATVIVGGWPLCAACGRDALKMHADLVIRPVADPRAALGLAL